MSGRKAALIAALFAVAFLPLKSRAQASLEALKAGTLPSSVQSILRNPPAAPEAPGDARAQSASYESGEYRNQWDARRALDDAQTSLRRAGLAVLGARVLPPAGERRTYAIHVDYADPQERPDHPARTVETYTSGEFASSYQAGQEMDRSLASLRGAGYVPVRAQVVQRQGKFDYQVDYVQGQQNPARQVGLYTSGYYLWTYRGVAYNDMLATMALLQAQGCTILAYALFPVPGTAYWVYQVRYLAP